MIPKYWHIPYDKRFYCFVTYLKTAHTKKAKFYCNQKLDIMVKWLALVLHIEEISPPYHSRLYNHSKLITSIKKVLNTYISAQFKYNLTDPQRVLRVVKKYNNMFVRYKYEFTNTNKCHKK